MIPTRSLLKWNMLQESNKRSNSALCLWNTINYFISLMSASEKCHIILKGFSSVTCWQMYLKQTSKNIPPYYSASENSFTFLTPCLQTYYKFRKHSLLQSGWNHWLLCSNNVAHSNRSSLVIKILPVRMILLLIVTTCMKFVSVSVISINVLTHMYNVL